MFAVTAPSGAAVTNATKAKATKTKSKTTFTSKVKTTSRPATTATTAKIPAVTGSINVFAAASLTASFTDIADAFEKVNPGAKVTLNFAGSSTLAAQITNGAPADVFASADTTTMERLLDANQIRGTPVIFTRNKPMIVVPKGNPLRVKGLADLARPEVFVALGAVGVPAGDYARQILARAGVAVSPKSLEASVSAIVSKAALKEIDAGIVYVTDVAMDDFRVDGIAIPDEQNVVASYPIAAIASGRNSATAASFIAYVQSASAQSVLKKYKFLPLK